MATLCFATVQLMNNETHHDVDVIRYGDMCVQVLIMHLSTAMTENMTRLFDRNTFLTELLTVGVSNSDV